MPIVARTPKPTTDVELFAKMRRHLHTDNMIHDRHPVITELIYARVLRGIDRTHDATWNSAWTSLLLQRPIIILARGSFFDRHVAKPDESKTHLVDVRREYDRIKVEYDAWGIQYSHIIYNHEDDIERIISMVRGVINERFL